MAERESAHRRGEGDGLRAGKTIQTLVGAGSVRRDCRTRATGTLRRNWASKNGHGRPFALCDHSTLDGACARLAGDRLSRPMGTMELFWIVAVGGCGCGRWRS